MYIFVASSNPQQDKIVHKHSNIKINSLNVLICCKITKNRIVVTQLFTNRNADTLDPSTSTPFQQLI